MKRVRKLELGETALVGAIVGVAFALRMWSIELDAQNPFYDAAVRSMGLTWHNFFFGALDPSAKLAIDKPPLDLWLQVACTKLLGFNRTALAIPEALGGTAAVALLYLALAHAYGRLVGAFAALTLALLPISVLTSRSDTMDSLMSALLVGALWTSIVALASGKRRYVLLSAAFVGLAFNVKLTLALVPLPALALLWWVASRARRHATLVAMTGVVLAGVAMAWAFTASLTPLSARPFPMGSRTGSIYRAMFVYNGLERLTGVSHELTPYGFSSRPGFQRLFGVGQPHYGTLVGLVLVAALSLLMSAGAVWLLERGSSVDPATVRPAWPATVSNKRTLQWLTVALVMWLATAYLLFSFMGRLQPRYLEAMSPALAAILAITVTYLLAYAHTRRAAWLCAAALAVNAGFAVHACGTGDIGVQLCLLMTAITLSCLCVAPLRRVLFGIRAAATPRLRVALLALVSLALLAAPAEASIDLVEEHTSDANPTGSGSQFGAYLQAHRDGARYEAAAASPLSVVGLIASDAQPVLILRSIDGVLVSVSELRQLVKEGAVRYVILPHPCSSGRHCTPTTAWSVRHSVRVRPGLYRYLISSRRHATSRGLPSGQPPQPSR